jgi:phage virion morphogenesis protein
MNDLANEFNKIEQWIAPLIKKASISDRRKLARRIGNQLRASQSARIRDQKNPDGTPYLSRKTPSSKRMFDKIRQRPHLRMQSDANSVEVGFRGRASNIAEIHQEGLSDSPNPSGKKIRYTRRELLGFSEQDTQNINDLLIEHLTD